MQRKREKSRDFESGATLVDALVDTLQSRGLTDQARHIRIARLWPKVVGETIAKRTQPLNYSRGVLIIKTASAAWQNELTFLKQELKTKLNHALGKELVTDIKILSGTRQGPRQPQEEDEAEPWVSQAPTPEEIERARALGETIGDDGIRDAFTDLMELAQRSERRRPESQNAETHPPQAASKPRE